MLTGGGQHLVQIAGLQAEPRQTAPRRAAHIASQTQTASGTHAHARAHFQRLPASSLLRHMALQRRQQSHCFGLPAKARRPAAAMAATTVRLQCPPACWHTGCC